MDLTAGLTLLAVNLRFSFGDKVHCLFSTHARSLARSQRTSGST